MEETSVLAMANSSHGVEEQNRVIDVEAKLENYSPVYFDMMYFEDCLLDGKWDEAEKYLSGFLKIDQNNVSLEIFYEIRKQNYLEALDRKDYYKAVEILKKGLKFFARYNQYLFTETTMPLTLDDFRENIQLSNYGDTNSARANLLNALKPKLEKCTFLSRKHEFCYSDNSKLTTPVNQRENPKLSNRGNTESTGAKLLTLRSKLEKHIAPCSIPNPLTDSNTTIPAPALPMMFMMPMQNRNPIPFVSFFTPNRSMGSNRTSPFQPTSAPHRVPMPSPSSVPHQAVSSQPFDQNAPAAHVTEPPFKRRKHAGTVEKVNDSPVSVSPGTYFDALPQLLLSISTRVLKYRAWIFILCNKPYFLLERPMVISPSGRWGEQHGFFVNLLKFGTLGHVHLLSSDSTAAVNCVIWSPDGAFFGVAYSKHLVHIYSYSGDDLKRYIEIDSHVGNVYDISFFHQSTSLCIITCGEDHAIRMWMADGGNRFSQVYNLLGHEAPVYSLCPKEDGKQYLFSADTNGKINAWIYNKKLFTCDACPSRGRLACSADGTRLFFCGTDSNGDSFLVEWDHKEGGEVKRTYQGLRSGSADDVQFDTANNQILAAGDEFQVKFWSMDSVKQLSYTFAAGGLPSRPCVRFNKGGTLLGVSTLENGVRVLANACGLQLLSSMEKCPLPSIETTGVIANGFATATHDKVVGGSPGFNSVRQQSSGISSSEQQSPGFNSVRQQSSGFSSSAQQSPGFSPGNSVD